MDSTQHWIHGLACYGKGDYFSAIAYYDKALASMDVSILDATSIIYTNRATALGKLMKYEEAIKDYTFVINYDKIEFHSAYYGRGVVRMKTLNYDEAISDFNSAIKMSDNFGLAYYCRATAYMEIGKYEDAEKDYKKAIELCNYMPPCAPFFNGLGNAKYRLRKYEEAIEHYDSAIKIDPNFVAAYNNKGNALYKLNKLHTAQENFKTAIALNPRDANQYKWQLTFDYVLPKFVDDIETYSTARKLDESSADCLLLDVLRLMKEGKEDYSEIAKVAINLNNYLLNTTALDVDNREKYGMLYLQVLKIISLLHLDKITFPISHYTSKVVVTSLLFESSPLRFSSVIKANDEYEGIILHKFLNINQDIVSDSQAYIACFVTDEDNHNMFRLYGKTNNEESSGFCLSIDKKFFSEKLIFISNYKQEIQEKASLFRCVYMHYNKNNPNDLIYVTDVSGDDDYMKTEAQTNLSILKAIVDNNTDLNKLIIGKLIAPLRYLIKIDSWKEEKEYRIIKIVQPDDPCILVDEHTKRTFINYSTLNNFITNIYIGCNAFKKEEALYEFINHLNINSPHIHCIPSRHKNRT